MWITSAVFLHTLGSAWFYALIPWWDHLTHALSASLVAGAGYTTLRAIDLHSDQVEIPARFAFVFIFVVVLAFGVVWELFEFALDIVSAKTGISMPLAQHGLDDTVLDQMYNSVGGVDRGDVRTGAPHWSRGADSKRALRGVRRGFVNYLGNKHRGFTVLNSHRH